MGRGPSWTKEEQETLRHLVDAGATVASAADAIDGRSVAAVQKKATKLHIKRAKGPMNKALVDKIVAAYGGPLSASELAMRYGITRNAVIGHWSRARHRFGTLR
mgnify:CR=1 FL=1